MFDTICDVIFGLFCVLVVGLAILVFVCLGCSIHDYSVAPYIISTDENDYFIKEYREEDGYYYATTIHGNEYKIPIGIAVVNKNK